MADAEDALPGEHTIELQQRILGLDPKSRSEEQLKQLSRSLGEVEFFKKIDPVVRTQLCRVMRLQRLEADKVVFVEGDPGELFYVILSGACAVYTDGAFSVKKSDSVTTSHIMEHRGTRLKDTVNLGRLSVIDIPVGSEVHDVRKVERTAASERVSKFQKGRDGMSSSQLHQSLRESISGFELHERLGLPQPEAVDLSNSPRADADRTKSDVRIAKLQRQLCVARPGAEESVEQLEWLQTHGVAASPRMLLHVAAYRAGRGVKASDAGCQEVSGETPHVDAGGDDASDASLSDGAGSDGASSSDSGIADLGLAPGNSDFVHAKSFRHSQDSARTCEVGSNDDASSSASSKETDDEHDHHDRQDRRSLHELGAVGRVARDSKHNALKVVVAPRLKDTILEHVGQRTVRRVGDQASLRRSIGPTRRASARLGDEQFTIEDVRSRLVEVAVLRSGAAFGEVALQTNQPRSATVATKEETLLATLSGTEYRAILSRIVEQKQQEKHQFLCTVPCLETVQAYNITKIAHMMQPRMLARNELVYDVGSPLLQVYMLKEGELAVCYSTRRIEEEEERHEDDANGNANSASNSKDGVKEEEAFGVKPQRSKASANRRTKSDQWLVASVVTPGTVVGLPWYLIGERRSRGQVRCLTAHGFVYSIFAKELVGHLPREVRSDLQAIAHVQERFYGNRIDVLRGINRQASSAKHQLSDRFKPTRSLAVTRMEAARRDSVQGNVYTLGNRLQLIEEAVEQSRRDDSLSKEEKGKVVELQPCWAAQSALSANVGNGCDAASASPVSTGRATKASRLLPAVFDQAFAARCWEDKRLLLAFGNDCLHTDLPGRPSRAAALTSSGSCANGSCNEADTLAPVATEALAVFAAVSPPAPGGREQHPPVPASFARGRPRPRPAPLAASSTQRDGSPSPPHPGSLASPLLPPLPTVATGERATRKDALPQAAATLVLPALCSSHEQRTFPGRRTRDVAPEAAVSTASARQETKVGPLQTASSYVSSSATSLGDSASANMERRMLPETMCLSAAEHQEPIHTIRCSRVNEAAPVCDARLSDEGEGATSTVTLAKEKATTLDTTIAKQEEERLGSRTGAVLDNTVLRQQRKMEEYLRDEQKEEQHVVDHAQVETQRQSTKMVKPYVVEAPMSLVASVQNAVAIFASGDLSVDVFGQQAYEEPHPHSQVASPPWPSKVQQSLLAVDSEASIRSVLECCGLFSSSVTSQATLPSTRFTSRSHLHSQISLLSRASGKPVDERWHEQVNSVLPVETESIYRSVESTTTLRKRHFR